MGFLCAGERYVSIIDNFLISLQLDYAACHYCYLGNKDANKDAKDKDWHRLGYILKKTADSHKLLSPEIDDLFLNIKNGNLKG